MVRAYRVENPSTPISSGQLIAQAVSCNDTADIMTGAGFNISNVQYAVNQGLIPRPGQLNRWDGQFAHVNFGGNNFPTSFRLYGICIDVTP